MPSFLHFLQTSLDWTFCPHALWAVVDGIDHINSPPVPVDRRTCGRETNVSGRHGLISTGTALFHWHPGVGNSGNCPTVWVAEPEDSLNKTFSPASVLAGPSEVLSALWRRQIYWIDLWRWSFSRAGWLRTPRRPTAAGHQQLPDAGESWHCRLVRRPRFMCLLLTTSVHLLCARWAR